MCLLQNPRETHLSSCQTNHLPTATAGAGAFKTGGRLLTRSHCSHRISRIFFRLNRSRELFLSISQQPTTLHGIAASPASFCDCYLTDKWSAWSLRLLVIAASPSPLETANSVGYIRRFENDVPQESVLVTFFFNLYISDLPTTVSGKYAYADDLAIMHADETGRLSKGYWARTWQP